MGEDRLPMEKGKVSFDPRIGDAEINSWIP